MSENDLFIDEFVSQAITQKLRNFYRNESLKGCNGFIYNHSVDIRPVFDLFQPENFDKNISTVNENLERKPKKKTSKFKQLRIWFHKNDVYKGERIERFIRQMSAVDSPVMFEIVGNKKEISILFSTKNRNVALLENIVSTHFPLAEVENMNCNLNDNFKERKFVLRDFYPAPPYFRMLTSFPNIQENSPLENVFSILNSLDEDEIGIYRIVIHSFPQGENWHRNFVKLIYCEQQANGNNFLNLYSDTTDSGFLCFGKTNSIIEKKAHPDFPFVTVKPLFIALVKSESYGNISKSIDAFARNYRYGGKPLNVHTEEDYFNVIEDRDKVINNLLNYKTYTQGMILNTLETISFINIPESIFKRYEYNVNVADGIKIPETLREGKVYLGESRYGHRSSPVFIPANAQGKHAHIIGKIGYGKSTLLENLVLEDIKNGIGLCVVDPHGDLIDSLLSKIPDDKTEDVIYFNPTIEGHFPSFNPFDVAQDKNISILSENYVYAFKKIFSRWGDRMERILRNTFYLLLSNRELTLSDAPKILSNTDEGKALRLSSVKNIDNPVICDFWESEFDRLGQSAIEPIHNKISKLLTNKNLNQMFSSTENRFNLKEIMNSGKILLVKLPTGILGIDSADILGSMIISLFHQETISRASIPQNRRRPFNIYIDEFHRFTGREIEDFIVDGRKYKVGVILAHQQSSQLPDSVSRILGNCFVLVALHNDFQEAKQIIREFPCKIEPEEILKLNIGEALVRIGNQVAKVKLKPPSDAINFQLSSVIKEKSFSHYYRNNLSKKRNHIKIDETKKSSFSRRSFCQSLLE